MSWVRKSVLLVLLAIWVPVTVHCELELIPGLSFLACTDEGAPHADAECNDDSCAEVESACYRLEDNPSPILLPAATALLLVSPVADTRVPTKAGKALSRMDTRDASPQGWHFARRAALPPRAPCFIC